MHPESILIVSGLAMLGPAALAASAADRWGRRLDARMLAEEACLGLPLPARFWPPDRCGCSCIRVIPALLLACRCRRCGRAIARGVALAEIALALMPAAAVAWAGIARAGAVLALAGVSVILLALMDARHTVLPQPASVLLTWSLLLSAALGWIPPALPDAVVGAAVAWAGIALLGALTGGIAEGDAWLAGALGAAAGIGRLAPFMALAALLAIATVLLVSARRRHRRLRRAGTRAGPLGLIVRTIIATIRHRRPALTVPWGPFLGTALIAALLLP